VRSRRSRRALAAGCCLVLLGLGSAACSDSKDGSGASTDLDEVGPQISKLRLEVQQLRKEVQTLREEVAVLTPATDPQTGLPAETSTTTTTAGEAITTTTSAPG
jgi:hypothetical protein